MFIPNYRRLVEVISSGVLTGTAPCYSGAHLFPCSQAGGTCWVSTCRRSPRVIGVASSIVIPQHSTVPSASSSEIPIGCCLVSITQRKNTHEGLPGNLTKRAKPNTLDDTTGRNFQSWLHRRLRLRRYYSTLPSTLPSPAAFLELTLFFYCFTAPVSHIKRLF